MIKAIFVDIDNTILDFDAYVEKALEDGFSTFELGEFNADVLNVFHTENNKLWKRIEQKTLDLKRLQKIRFNNIFDVLGIDFDGRIFEKYFRRQLCESAIPVECAKELLSELSKDYIVCTASNGPFLRRCHRMELADFSKYISFDFISEKIGFSKPSKEFFEKSFEILNAEKTDKILPGQTVMLGDSLSADISGGKAFGMKTILFDKHKKHLEKTIADFRIEHLSEAIEIIKNLD